MSQPSPGQSGSAPSSKTAWAPLRRPLFRALWIAQLVANTGTWMQTVGAQWLMGDLGGGTLAIALVQTATTLPVFLLVIPAGALGDILDRRRLLLTSQAITFVGAAGLAALTAANATTPALLLMLIGLMAVGQALAIPTFQAIQPELVSRDEIPQAALLNGANGNVARAVGPALGGVLIAAVGPEATFAFNALSFFGVIVVLFIWKRPPDHRPLGAEHIVDAIRAGARYVRSAPEFATVLLCSMVFAFSASATWALLPALARGPLGLSAGGYGLLLTAVGSGAVMGTFVLPMVRARWGPNAIVAVSTIGYALTMIIIGTVGSLPAILAALVVAGMAWIAVLSTLGASAQLLLPAWTRARSLAYYQLVFMGGQAVGALAWGLVADGLALRAAFLIPAAVLILSTPIGVLRVPLPDAPLDMRSVRHYPEPPEDLKHGRGPVLVVVEWRVVPENAEEFLEVMRKIGRARRRTGATMWGIFQDMEEPTLYLETFTVQTAHEHLRQHVERGTAMEQEFDLQALSLVMEGTFPYVRHLLWAYAADPDAEGKDPKLKSFVALLRPR